ncbi:hypothetical protein PACTADRAFT_32995 [Pachysolen tannophilus NRRL Y-2460]|uniref:Uncharacterized protein n=1 Tax=Pachysolen tannophilus NRRL Y-2460 TaxID=669874 RepID=A0A1E4TVM7_PACTA|nr:hypothetical protein PACTADRAFT_32995 [Pachysolen tannophilus NRRL Y-2460]
MGKGVAKFGGKSGILPLPRQIFKQPIKPLKIEHNPNIGYAPDVKHPRGSTREPIYPKVVPVEERIVKTIAAPKRNFTEEEFGKLPIAQQWKLKNSALRRDYLKDSYWKEAKRLELKEAREEEAKKKLEEEIKKAQQYEESTASKLTLPSVEQYLKGPIMRQRTEAETKELQAKRKLNLLNHELRLKEKKAADLLELYNASTQFIITEEQLADAVSKAFDTNSSYSSAFSTTQTFKSLSSTSNSRVSVGNDIDTAIANALLGRVNGGPDLNDVKDTLHGETYKLVEEAGKNFSEMLQKDQQKYEKKYKDN